MSKSVLEVIVCTLDDAVEAEMGGADRLEVVSRLDLGGLTPSPDLVRQIKTRVSLPLRVMVREGAGFATSGQAELKRFCKSVNTFNEIGVDGIVLGFLKRDELHVEVMRTILASAPQIKATFHHAFEATQDKHSAIEALKEFPQIDRLLTHGGNGTWTEKIERLDQYRQAAFPEMLVIAGGGLDLSIIKLIRSETAINEFHVGSAARVDGKVGRVRVAELASLIHV